MPAPKIPFPVKKKKVKMRPLLKETLFLLPTYEKNPKKHIKVEWKDELEGQSILVMGHEDSLKTSSTQHFYQCL